MKRISLYISFLILSLSLSAQDWGAVEIEDKQVADNIYVLKGRGGNMAVLIGEDGSFLIDSQFGPLSDKIKSKVKALSPNAVRYLVNTHWHGDHTGGNENFSKDGALIIAHENVRERVSTEQFNKAWNRKTPPKPESAWPLITFAEGLNLHVNGEDIHLFHVHNAHTDGDSFVYFTQANVLHMGDCFFNKRFPYIDLSSGGSVDGAIEAIKAALMVVNDETVIIPGHGDLASKEDLRIYHEMLTTMKQRVVDGIAEGKSLEELKTAGLDKGYESWGEYFISTETLVDVIWTDLDRQ